MTISNDPRGECTVSFLEAVKISQARRLCGWVMAEIYLPAASALSCRREMIDKLHCKIRGRQFA